MGRTYYYFVASLPMLDYEGKPPMSVEEFLRQCQQLLVQEDYGFMQKLLTEDEYEIKTHNYALRSWAQFNQNFRNEIAYFRAKRANKDPKEYLRGEHSGDTNLHDIIQQASKASDPLAAEKILDRTKWQFLDTLISGHYFDIEVLIVYGLKLKILERYQAVGSPRGNEIFEGYKKIKIPELSKV